MPEPDEELQRALALAYAYLNRRERTVNEMRAYLERHGIQTAAVAGAVATLSEHGVLDDARFVRLFAQDKRELEDWGSERIRRTLLGRGVDRDLIDDSLRDGEDGGEDAGDGGERRRALALLSRRFPTPPADRRERERALGVLLRKGYDSNVALDALAAYAHAVDDRDLL